MSRRGTCFPSRTFLSSIRAKKRKKLRLGALSRQPAFCKRRLSDFKLLSRCNFPAASRRKRRLQGKRCSPDERCKKSPCKKEEVRKRERSAFTRLRRGRTARRRRGSVGGTSGGRERRDGEKEKNCPVVEVNIFRS